MNDYAWQAVESWAFALWVLVLVWVICKLATGDDDNLRF